MRRALPVIAGTAGGLALLANFHAAPSTNAVAAGAPGGRPAVATPATDPQRGMAVPAVPAPTTTAPAATHTVDGPVVATEYGNVQVAVQLDGSKIVDVKALLLPNDRSRSARISQQAGPILRQEALRAQSGDIDLVSGATYTSEGYIRSLQAALTRAGR